MLNLIKPKRKVKEPDLVPMINVIFLLLCFFLIAGTVAKQDPVEVNAPESRTSAPFMTKNFTLFVTKDGTLMFEEQRVTLAQLAVRLQPLLSKNREMPLLVKADAELSAASLNNLVKGLEQMGVINLSLATEAK